MQLPYAGGFKESARQVATLEKAGLDIVWVAEAYGFDAVSLMGYLAAQTETVQIGSGSSQAVLLVGKAAGEGAVYAKDQSRPAVLTIDSSILEELKKDSGDYRQKDLFDARTFNATAVDLTYKGQALAFEKTKVKNKDGQEQETWRQTAPAAQDANQTAVENLISAATQARADSFVDTTAKTGLDSPELTATIKSGEGRSETVRFGRSGSDAYAARAGEPGAAKIPTATLDNIVKAVQELQKPAAK